MAPSCLASVTQLFTTEGGTRGLGSSSRYCSSNLAASVAVYGEFVGDGEEVKEKDAP